MYFINRKHLLRCILRHLTIFSTFHVQTLDFGSISGRIDDLDGCIFLLLQKKQSAEYAIEIDFQKFVAIVHGLPELSGYLHGFLEGLGVRINEHGIRVTINDLRRRINNLCRRAKDWTHVE